MAAVTAVQAQRKAVAVVLVDYAQMLLVQLLVAVHPPIVFKGFIVAQLLLQKLTQLRLVAVVRPLVLVLVIVGVMVVQVQLQQQVLHLLLRLVAVVVVDKTKPQILVVLVVVLTGRVLVV